MNKEFIDYCLLRNNKDFDDGTCSYEDYKEMERSLLIMLEFVKLKDKEF